MSWVRENTSEDAVFSHWWDYGYWITTMSDRATLADNFTGNHTRIELIAQTLL